MNKQVLNQEMHSRTTTRLDYLFYREAGDPSDPKMVLLHGFSCLFSSVPRLISVLADHFHVVAPDCPGFGNSDLPSPDEFNYTFDRLSLWIS